MITHENLYELSTGRPVTSLVPFSSPVDEYRTAFENRVQPFLVHYSLDGRNVQKRTLTRGEFWDLACSAAVYLTELGLSKGYRIAHFFSSNSIHDLVFRLAAVLVGSAPVTINWQADNNETILYKVKATGAKLIIYDEGLTSRVEELRPELSPASFLAAAEVERFQHVQVFTPTALSYEDERIIVFTSGTTGKPKGVSLSHRSYLANRLTLEQYFEMSEATKVDLFLVNPLHHANSSAFCDWGMRRGGTIIHLLQHYTTDYWRILVEVASRKRDLLIAPIVSRHIDFLESLATQAKLPIEEAKTKEALSQTDILIGSAPVGPTTIKRVLKFSNHLPRVRFGSTETCLQVMATPRTMSQDELLKAFETGWSHHHNGKKLIGYYIGREHSPFTRVKVVKAIDPESNDYFRSCEIGEPGYLVTQGPNIMSYYVGDAEATKAVFREGWYTGLRDIVFTLKNRQDGQLDYYWMTRDSALLIRGGANYAYDQVAAELSQVLIKEFHLDPEQFKLAVVGLRVKSEHEDSCCVTIELSSGVAAMEPELQVNFVEKARQVVSKGARPDYIRFARIPLNFKGEVLASELKQDFKKLLEHQAMELYE